MGVRRGRGGHGQVVQEKVVCEGCCVEVCAVELSECLVYGGVEGVGGESGDLLETGEVDGGDKVGGRPAEVVHVDGNAPLAERVDNFLVAHRRKPILAGHGGRRRRGRSVTVTALAGTRRVRVCF